MNAFRPRGWARQFAHVPDAFGEGHRGRPSAQEGLEGALLPHAPRHRCRRRGRRLGIRAGRRPPAPCPAYPAPRRWEAPIAPASASRRVPRRGTTPRRPMTEPSEPKRGLAARAALGSGAWRRGRTGAPRQPVGRVHRRISGTTTMPANRSPPALGEQPGVSDSLLWRTQPHPDARRRQQRRVARTEPARRHGRPLAMLRACRAGAGLGTGYAPPSSRPSDRFGQGQVLHALDEVERVSALAAPEAVVPL